MKVHCLFEQSGTFKNEFKKLGYDAKDYDILNDFGETDCVIDLFEQIEGGYNNEPSIFDDISQDDLIIAFFPCTMFQENNTLWLQGTVYQMANYSLSKKLETIIARHDNLCLFYKRLCQLVKIATDRGLKLIVENPATKPHYLDLYWLPPTMTDKDRTIRGDWYKKPTNYWFFNCEPKNNFIFEAIEHIERKRIKHIVKDDMGLNRTIARSMIHPQYANRFIREFILEDGS